MSRDNAMDKVIKGRRHQMKIRWTEAAQRAGDDVGTEITTVLNLGLFALWSPWSIFLFMALMWASMAHIKSANNRAGRICE